MTKARVLTFGLTAALLAAPALADVKAGVDAWSRGDYAAAIKEWRQPAIDGDADAQFNLGQAYKLGRGVPVDLKLAEDWYRKAAAQGHIQAEDNYGLVLFQNGDRQKALPIIQKSVARGEPRAQYILATALFNGDLVKKDWPRAYALMTRASAAGLAPATASLAQMDKYIPLEQRQQGLAQARELEGQGSRSVAYEDAAANPPPRPAVAPRTETPTPRTAAPAPKPVPKPAVIAASKSLPAPRPETQAGPASGRWRVQLGALADQAKAKTQWAKLRASIPALSGLQPSYEVAGAFVRLRAGPLASKDAAEKLCAAAKAGGAACFPVAP